MFEFFKKSKTKVGSEESAAPVTPGLVVAQARMRPLCFLDFDDKGLFLRFVHVSSSVYVDTY
ncbi:hypothetical protein [Herbaspirillum huttiense]|uniref:hypothetical protein n=1 Tax=Herbaspirillum huttiense TaxID=863372 RepID=UPI0031DFD62F